MRYTGQDLRQTICRHNRSRAEARFEIDRNAPVVNNKRDNN